MKLRFLIVLISIPLFTFAQKRNEANVLSYYAVTNSIDGQPLINKRNLLRFYPVFVLRDSITSVNFNIYYGNEVFKTEASKFNDGLFWEAMLPEFDFGDAIQRYEVQTNLKYDINLKRQLSRYKSILESELKKLLDSGAVRLKNFNEEYERLNNSFKNSTERILKYNAVTDLTTEALRISLDKFGKDSIVSHLNTLLLKLQQTDTTNSIVELQSNMEEIKNKIDSIYLMYNEIKGASMEIKEGYIMSVNNLNTDLISNFTELLAPLSNSANQQKLVAKFITSQEYLIDSLKGNLIRKLTDKDFSGAGIQKSDIVFDKNFETAKILYRNYRTENRTLVALDPAEKLSIFRLRYIPFPVVGKRLEGPSVDGIPVVFEAGITFGNQVITSNEFAKPELSIQRLGVAFAFTPKFFSSDAEILALLFSYDFNAYASIGIGANFGTISGNRPDPYFSFGINQKAFQRLVVGIANIFSR
jgi:hypothetical protein